MRVNAFVEGSLDAATLVQEARAAYGKYKIGIRSTAPEFLPYSSRGSAQADMNAGRTTRFLRLDDEDDVDRLIAVSYIYLDDVRNRINQ